MPLRPANLEDRFVIDRRHIGLVAACKSIYEESHQYLFEKNTLWRAWKGVADPLGLYNTCYALPQCLGLGYADLQSVNRLRLGYLREGATRTLFDSRTLLASYFGHLEHLELFLHSIAFFDILRCWLPRRRRSLLSKLRWKRTQTHGTIWV